jgi:hypothetical protein
MPGSQSMDTLQKSTDNVRKYAETIPRTFTGAVRSSIACGEEGRKGLEMVTAYVMQFTMAIPIKGHR